MGCSSSKRGSVAAGGNAPDITGKWTGKMEMPKGTEDNPMAKMGEAFGQMLLGDLTLEFQPGDKFKLTMMGIPMEGTVERKGVDLTLTTERAMGMAVEEMKKNNPKFAEDKMYAKIEADGSKITVTDKDAKAEKGSMVFRRTKDQPKKEVASTVADSEKGLVGSYGGQLEGQTEAKSAQERAAAAFVKAATLELAADNTFKMTMLVSMEGTWKVVGETVVLHMTKMMGMQNTEKKGESNEEAKLTIGPGGKLIPVEKPGATGPKMSFVKKS